MFLVAVDGWFFWVTDCSCLGLVDSSVLWASAFPLFRTVIRRVFGFWVLVFGSTSLVSGCGERLLWLSGLQVL